MHEMRRGWVESLENIDFCEWMKQQGCFLVALKWQEGNWELNQQMVNWCKNNIGWNNFDITSDYWIFLKSQDAVSFAMKWG